MQTAIVRVWLVCLAAIVIASVAASEPARHPRRIESGRLPNAFRVTDKVISGGQPAGEAAFKELQELGVKTVISVDGAKLPIDQREGLPLRGVGPLQSRRANLT